MHAYLFVGLEISDNQTPIVKLAESLNAKIMEFPLLKIEDVRSLNKLVRLSFKNPTLILCKNIHEATEEALNALLKNLEEPQENIYFALTAPSAKKVLPTIVSRCQVVKITNNNLQITNKNIEKIEKFWKMGTGEKLKYIDGIKDRAKAIEFAENMVNFAHGSLTKNEIEYDFSAGDIRLILKTLSRLKANGNVNLQLSNLVINLK